MGWWGGGHRAAAGFGGSWPSGLPLAGWGWGAAGAGVTGLGSKLSSRGAGSWPWGSAGELGGSWGWPGSLCGGGQQRPCKMFAPFVPSSSGAFSCRGGGGYFIYLRCSAAGRLWSRSPDRRSCWFSHSIFLARAVLMPPGQAVLGCPCGSGHGRRAAVTVRTLGLGGCRGQAAVGLVRECSHHIVITFC